MKQRPTRVELRFGGAPLVFEGERCLWRADDYLRLIAKVAPKRGDGNPIPVDITVFFGRLPDQYKGRIDLTREYAYIFDRGIIATEIYDFLTFMANERQPEFMTDEQWAAVRHEHIRNGWTAMAQAMLAQIDLSREAVRNFKR